MDDPESPVPVVEFGNVPIRKGGSGDGLTLSLGEGEVGFFRCPNPDQIASIGDLAIGLSDSDQGTVRYRGKAWAEMSEPEEEAARFEVGRVYPIPQRPAWLQNLDIDENILLPHLMKAVESPASLTERSRDLAKRFGLSEPPGMRPSKVLPRVLTISQWIRALLTEPVHLLILERPGRQVPDGTLRIFGEELKQLLKDGTAILWSDTDRTALEAAGISPTIEFDPFPANLIPSRPIEA